MMPDMSIELKWLPPFQGEPEVARTSATIHLRFGAENATRSWDMWSDSVQDGARVSAYPLATWLASSWWRIRWEPLPSRVRLMDDPIPADAGWRMSHELPAAGSGLFGPNYVSQATGNRFGTDLQAIPGLFKWFPVHYLSDFDLALPAQEFETESIVSSMLYFAVWMF